MMIEEIQRTGPISTARFMALALTHPTQGYYARHDPFGASGDFITAPEISQMFGELLGLWAAAVWQRMGVPARFMLVELGPGRGTLMADALRAASVVPAFGAAAAVHLV
jgi:NADH dehydrogenase [ubiquinone] 1 alpha subcomplex assembly factor 7